MTIRTSVQFCLTLGVLLGGLGCDNGGSSSKPGDDAGGCKPGAAGCACIDGERCEEGAACSAGMCSATTQQGWTVSDPNARACEALLTERTGSPLVQVGFASAARGTMVREAPLVGVSFVAREDAPLSSGIITTSAIGKGETPEVTSLRCFDASGGLLANATLTQD